MRSYLSRSYESVAGIICSLLLLYPTGRALHAQNTYTYTTHTCTSCLLACLLANATHLHLSSSSFRLLRRCWGTTTHAHSSHIAPFTHSDSPLVFFVLQFALCFFFYKVKKYGWCCWCLLNHTSTTSTHTFNN